MGDLPPMMGFSPGGGFPRLKPMVSLHFLRWTEVQLPLLKQGAPTETFQQITQNSRERCRER